LGKAHSFHHSHCAGVSKLLLTVATDWVTMKCLISSHMREAISSVKRTILALRAREAKTKLP